MKFLTPRSMHITVINLYINLIIYGKSRTWLFIIETSQNSALLKYFVCVKINKISKSPSLALLLTPPPLQFEGQYALYIFS